jgi:hypothetical protein
MLVIAVPCWLRGQKGQLYKASVALTIGAFLMYGRLTVVLLSTPVIPADAPVVSP